MAVLSSLLEKKRLVQKPSPPQVGFNNNVKHRGRVFHIQTEDSGVNHPHITTHLFVDGGRILRSHRTDYSEFIGNAELPLLLRKRMKDQHRAMFVALRRGQLDPLIDAMFGVDDAAMDVSSPYLVAAESTAEPAAGEVNSASYASVSGAPRSRPPVSFSRPRAPAGLLGIAEPQDAAVSIRGSLDERRGDDSPERSSVARPALFQGADSSSLYGDAKISEQSLDDVILSYISDDLQAPPEKG
jgi:hypothetical protein